MYVASWDLSYLMIQVRGIPRDRVRLEVVTLLRDVGLTSVSDQLAVSLTSGLQRRLCTALAVIGNPKVTTMRCFFPSKPDTNASVLYAPLFVSKGDVTIVVNCPKTNRRKQKKI